MDTAKPNEVLAKSNYISQNDRWKDSVFYSFQGGLLTTFEHYEEGGDQINTGYRMKEFVYDSFGRPTKMVNTESGIPEDFLLSVKVSGNIGKLAPLNGPQNTYLMYEYDTKINPLKGLVGLFNFPPKQWQRISKCS
jgi:hypothetical protein